MWTTGSVARSLPASQGWARPIQEQRSPASYVGRLLQFFRGSRCLPRPGAPVTLWVSGTLWVPAR